MPQTDVALQKIPILMYHSISDHAAPKFLRYTLPPKMFEKQMAYLVRQGFTSLTVTQLAQAMTNGVKLPRRPVVITFDDAYTDFYEHALPVLKKYNLTATLYIPTKHVGGTALWNDDHGEANRPLLDWSRLQELDAAGIECGAHTHSHPMLSQIPIEQAREEIFTSRQILEDKLGKPVTSFCYPFGDYDTAVRDAVAEAGFLAACAVNFQMSSTAEDVFALSRLEVKVTTDVIDFGALLEVFSAKVLRRLRYETNQLLRRN